MSARNKVLQVVSGWEAVQLVAKCIFVGVWQLLQVSVKRLWKGHRRKSRNISPVELTVDSSVGRHCYIKIMGVKYHYVETGPKTGQVVLVLSDAPDGGTLWCPVWTNTVRRLAESDHHVITLDIRGTGTSERGSRRDLSPARVVEEMSTLLEALGVSDINPAIVVGFGIGGLIAWYLVHCHGPLVRKFGVMGAPHPNLYWQYPPADFCDNTLYFIQWPFLPERWLAEGEVQAHGRSSRACDWTGALNYVRGAAWCRINPSHKASPPALLIGPKHSATQLVSSAAYCSTPTLKLVAKAEPSNAELSSILLDFLLGSKEEKIPEGKGLVGRMIGVMAGRGRELTARLVLPQA